jgi:hypothetical protein
VEYRWTGGDCERRGEVRKWTDVPLQPPSRHPCCVGHDMLYELVLFVQHHVASIMTEVTVPAGVASLAASVAGQCGGFLCPGAVRARALAQWHGPICGDTPQAPSPRIDRSRPKRSDVYRSSTQNADATTLRTLKVDDILLSILTVATPGDSGLSHL